jgi:hypothetical protein
VHETVNFTPPDDLVFLLAAGLAFVLFFAAGFAFLLAFDFAAFFETTGAG